MEIEYAGKIGGFSEKGREPWFDLLRGVAIIFVIGIHTSFDYGFDTVRQVALVVMRQAIGCAVPLFFAISGYFLVRKGFSAYDDKFWHFWRRQSWKVYLPVLVWSLPWLYLALFPDGLSGELHSARWWLILYFLCGLSVFYFVAEVIEFYALLPVLNKVKMGG